jgi:hypothetical protein
MIQAIVESSSRSVKDIYFNHAISLSSLISEPSNTFHSMTPSWHQWGSSGASVDGRRQRLSTGFHK